MKVRRVHDKVTGSRPAAKGWRLVPKHQAGKAIWFGHRLKKLLKGSLALWNEYTAETIDRPEYLRRGEVLKQAVSDHLRPRTLSDLDNQRLLDELGWHQGRGILVRFLDDPGIPPTNHAAKRSLRPPIIVRKVSHCSKTRGEAETFSAFSRVIRTAMKRRKDTVEQLCELFRRHDARALPI